MWSRCLQVRRRRAVVSVLLAAALATVLGTAAAQGATDARLLRFPDIHEDFVVFVYGGDLWRAPSAGGEARRLTAHEGQEIFPKISPDGRWIAYSAEYSGSRQVWVMPAEGGEPKQLTFYTDVGPMPPRGGWDYWVQGWTPEGKILVRANRTPWGVRMGRYFLVDPEGGLETPLPLLEGGGASMSPDGKALAYTPISREFRTWKRTRGGRAQDVWIYHLEEQRSQRLTEHPGTDNFPLWSGDTIYFTSDRGDTLNLWAVDTQGQNLRQITRFDTYDVLWPSLGPKSIVFENGGELHRLDLGSQTASKIPISISSERSWAMPRFVDASEQIQGADISPSGARAVFEARGELFTIPAEEGPTRRLTRSDGARDRDPSWSPDGRWIAYFSDRSGEYQLYLHSQDGSGETRQLTRDLENWPANPVWSPDSKQIAFNDRSRRLYIIDVASGERREIARGERNGINNFTWSPDGQWLAYGTTHASNLAGIALYSVDQNKSWMLGDGLTNDFSPAFSSDGKHLFFLSNRDFQLRFSDFEFNYIYDRSARVYAAALTADAEPLFPMKSDEQEVEEEKEEEGDKKDKEGDKDKEEEGEDEPEPLKMQPESFLARTIALPDVPAGNYFGLSATEGAVYYLRASDGPPSLYRYDLEKREEESVLSGSGGYALSADGKKLLYQSAGSWGIGDARPGLNAADGRLDLSGMEIKIDPRKEWAQIFEDGWRIFRDWFYDPNMHGFDWAALGERYRTLLPHAAHRGDLDFLFGELIGEVEAGHTYVGTGDQPQVERVQGAMLGAELELDSASGRFRIAHILPGENWHDAYRSPLTEPGIEVEEGNYLLAIDGEELKHPDNPYRLLEGKADQQVELSVASSADGERRQVVVRPISAEGNLRYLEWVQQRMELTDRLSDGRIGYIHLPNTAVGGNRMLQKLFYGQAHKDALIIDDRYNGGGFIPDRMIEMLARQPLAYWAQRDITPFSTPGFFHLGPKVMLVNGYSSSGGDALPYFFRKMELGPVIGTRTWGGLIGLTGAPALVDGGSVLPPTFRIFDTDGEWVVENEGVEPDIEVFDLPEALIAGGDPSLEKGVEVLLEALRQKDPEQPAVPAAPDLSGPNPGEEDDKP